jgi:hypothetical protein
MKSACSQRVVKEATSSMGRCIIIIRQGILCLRRWNTFLCPRSNHDKSAIGRPSAERLCGWVTYSQGVIEKLGCLVRIPLRLGSGLRLIGARLALSRTSRSEEPSLSSSQMQRRSNGRKERTFVAWNSLRLACCFHALFEASHVPMGLERCA